MRLDIVSIFPAYFSALELSLVGRARRIGLLDIRLHDLRDWTSDRHRTVDDSPYGGGAGMVMRPEPWGRALDELAPPDSRPTPRLVVPTPAGRRFDQRYAEDLAGDAWLIFACGRYEGIDQRVVDEASTRMAVDEISIGDYVVNGGEVATLVVVEAIARLLPGVLGNPDSLVEESHSTGLGGGLLEAPVYTKPALWRGRSVPEILLSGDHGAVERWRGEQALLRTARQRPDLLPPGLRDTASPRSRAGERHTGAVRFRTRVELGGKTATGLPVPDDVVEQLGPGKRPAVRVTIGDYTYRTTVAPMAGRYFVPLSAEHRSAAGVAAGDEVEIDIELDREPREVSVPADLHDALSGDRTAREFFDGLSYSRRKEWVRWVEDAKKADTRAARVAKAVSSLHAGKPAH